MEKDFLGELSSLNTFVKIKKVLSSSLSESNRFYTSLLPGSLKSLLIPAIIADYHQILILLPKRLDVNEMTVELSILGLEDKIVAIDNIEIDTIQERLTTIKNKKQCVIISTYNLLNVKLPSKSEIDKSTTQIEVGSDITYDDLIEYLDELKYEHEKFVTDPGYYAVRGSIIDFWSYSEEHPCRLEFDGDFLESIRFFEPESQRSTGRIENITLATSIESDGIAFDSDIFDYLKKPLVFA
ncbi:MAG: transcription-repair coupling factor, partial [Melioribacteraceae bacterium]|nr:transcription-repair coupling factor [Melioribacteraceae bacterium]